jgi:hypothetical protein
MKKEKDLFKKDLSNAEGSYTKCIGDNIALINDLGTDYTVDLQTYIKRIIELIKDAHDTPAKRKFVTTLQAQRNKMNAMLYVSNAYMKGIGLEVI